MDASRNMTAQFVWGVDCFGGFGGLYRASPTILLMVGGCVRSPGEMNIGTGMTADRPMVRVQPRLGHCSGLPGNQDPLLGDRGEFKRRARKCRLIT